MYVPDINVHFLGHLLGLKDDTFPVYKLTKV